MIEVLISYSPQDLADLNALMRELSATSFCSEALMMAMVEAARGFKAHHIQLTSNPSRIAANRLYQSLGFERYETNCYKKMML
ncbi:MAG: hypothetical protein IKR96_02560 [Bacteroidales bacterium]|nr:hypothetical protein [Bacteroidales bacterium]